MAKKKNGGCLGIVIIGGLIAVWISSLNDDSTNHNSTATKTTTSRDSEGSTELAKREQVIYDPLPTDAFDLTTNSGNTYVGATIRRVDESGLVISHVAGVTTIGFSDLENSFRERHGLTDERIAEHKSRLEAEAREEQQRKQNELQIQIDQEFLQSSKDAGWVTYIEQDGTNFHVRLPVDKYTTRDNVRSIAEFIARSYVMQSQNKGGTAENATVHVWQGDKVLVRGSYRK